MTFITAFRYGQDTTMTAAKSTLSGDAKICGRCKKMRPVSEFARSEKSADGYQWCCKPCKVRYRRDYLGRRENPKATEKRRAKVEFYFAHPTWSMQECAEALGISSEALSRAVNVEDRDKSRRIARRQEAAEIGAAEERQRRLAKAVPCLVCGDLVLRGEQLQTCSKRCATLWRKGARLRLSDEEYEKHRRSCAVSILRRPEKYRDVQIRWAEAILSDNPPPPNRRFEVEGSQLSKDADEARQLMQANMPKPQPDFIDWLEVG